ncbi:MAG TPA: ferredoxin [Porphyromonadaceae bacterium]|nr:ferredoxin [Porphyromonadaceae bacterium]
MDELIIPVILLGTIGALGAVLLYLVSKKFFVKEDERLGKIIEALPGANCGGCGMAGCANFAEACLKVDSLADLRCPVGGDEVMGKISAILGKEAPSVEPMMAVVRCAGSCSVREKSNTYDGTKSCTIASALYGGETGCPFGCLGFGDCLEVCELKAITINPETKLPEIDENKCGGCGSCVKVCPKGIIELRNRDRNTGRVFVSCVNKEKGAVARRACKVACIGCGKCAKICPSGAIVIENNLAYIDFRKCEKCGKCLLECPTGAITTNNPSLREKCKAEEEMKKTMQSQSILNKI